MFDRITVPLDLSSFTDRALPAADALARRAHLPIELVTVTRHLPDPASARAGVTAADHGLVAPVEALRVIEGDDTAQALTELVQGGQRLVCMTTHARRPFSDFALGPMARQVARCAPAPLALVGPRVDGNEIPLDGLLVALDGTEPPDQLLAAVGPLARLLEVHVAVISVEQVCDPWDPTSGTATRRLTDWLDDVVDRLRAAGVPATGAAKHSGRPAGVILGAAGRSTWIVLGQRRRSALERLADQSLSSRLLERSRSPVIALPRFTPVEPVEIRRPRVAVRSGAAAGIEPPGVA